MTRRFTKEQHLEAVALVLSGCSKSGVARYVGMSLSHLNQLLKSSVTQEHIDMFGGEASFIERFANDEDRTIIMQRTHGNPASRTY